MRFFEFYPVPTPAWNSIKAAMGLQSRGSVSITNDPPAWARQIAKIETTRDLDRRITARAEFLSGINKRGGLSYNFIRYNCVTFAVDVLLGGR